MGKTMGKHLLIFVGYFGVIVLVRVLLRGVGSLSLSTVWFLVGGLLGMALPMADRLGYVYYSRPQEQLSMQVKDLIKRGMLVQALAVMIARREEQVRLSMNNVLFLAVWVALSIFVITSTGKPLAIGMVLGVGLDLVFDLWKDRKRPEYLMGRLFWPLRRNIVWSETVLTARVFGAAFALVSLLAV